MEHLPQYLDDLRDVRSGGIRTEVLTRSIFIAYFRNLRNRSGRYPDIGEIFIVLHEDIVLWLPLLD